MSQTFRPTPPHILGYSSVELLLSYGTEGTSITNKSEKKNEKKNNRMLVTAYHVCDVSSLSLLLAFPCINKYFAENWKCGLMTHLLCLSGQ